MRTYRIGVDEVGRGALAGPVLVCAVAIPLETEGTLKTRFPSLRDSKKMTPLSREVIFTAVRNGTRKEIYFTSARTSPGKIDALNVSRSANDAARRAVTKLMQSINERFHENVVFDIVFDGGLFFRSKAYQTTALLIEHPCVVSASTVIRADASFPSVSLASVIGKVTRDAYMKRLAERHTVYGFETHKGYGTKTHRERIKTFGPSPEHRLTFLRKYSSI